MELREPKRKRVGSHIKPQQPFPILIESESGIPVSNELWPLYVGSFTGDGVVVHNPEEMKSLYTMGFFGKGSFSRGYPSFGLTKKGMPPVIKERQWKRRKTWMDQAKNNMKSPCNRLETNNCENCEEEIERRNKPTQTEDLSNEPVTLNVSSIDQNQFISDDGANDNIKNDRAKCQQLKCVTNEDCELLESDFSDKVLVLADSDDDDIEKVIRDPLPHLEDEQIKTAVETLNLTLEEAFFLSYALGCLHVIDSLGQTMSLKQMWHTFCEIKPSFIQLYVVYHYYRAKGWIVKSGYKFGGDFLLYKQGPPFYHASYIVLIEKVDSKLKRCQAPLTWTKLHGLNRLAESSGKDIIICQVMSPSRTTREELFSPDSLPRYQVNEQLIRRWISSQERVEKDQC